MTTRDRLFDLVTGPELLWLAGMKGDGQKPGRLTMAVAKARESQVLMERGRRNGTISFAEAVARGGTGGKKLQEGSPFAKSPQLDPAEDASEGSPAWKKVQMEKLAADRWKTLTANQRMQALLSAGVTEADAAPAVDSAKFGVALSLAQNYGSGRKLVAVVGQGWDAVESRRRMTEGRYAGDYKKLWQQMSLDQRVSVLRAASSKADGRSLRMMLGMPFNLPQRELKKEVDPTALEAGLKKAVRVPLDRLPGWAYEKVLPEIDVLFPQEPKPPSMFDREFVSGDGEGMEGDDDDDDVEGTESRRTEEDDWTAGTKILVVNDAEYKGLFGTVVSVNDDTVTVDLTQRKRPIGRFSFNRGDLKKVESRSHVRESVDVARVMKDLASEGSATVFGADEEFELTRDGTTREWKVNGEPTGMKLIGDVLKMIEKDHGVMLSTHRQAPSREVPEPGDKVVDGEGHRKELQFSSKDDAELFILALVRWGAQEYADVQPELWDVKGKKEIWTVPILPQHKGLVAKMMLPGDGGKPEYQNQAGGKSGRWMPGEYDQWGGGHMSRGWTYAGGEDD